MQRLILTAGAVATLVLASASATAQPYDSNHPYYHHHHHHHYYDGCSYQRHRSGAIGAVSGAIGGGLIGGAISHGAGGALLGAGAGALVGNAIGRNSHHC